MLKHHNGIVYVNDEPTTNAELIGLAYLDMVENSILDKEYIRKEILKLFERKTSQRIELLKIILDDNVTDFNEILRLCFVRKIKISVASVYNFVNVVNDTDLIYIKLNGNK